MKKIIFLLSVFLLGMVRNSFAIDEVIKNYRGIRSLGMGGVTFSTGLYDENLFANPALHGENPVWKLSLFNITAEMNNHLMSNINDLSNISSSNGTATLAKLADSGLLGENQHARLTLLPGFYSPRMFGARNSFAFGFLINSQNNIMLRNNAAVEAQLITDVGPAIGFSRKFLKERLSIGLNLRVMYRLAGDKVLKATDFLAGSGIKPKNLAGQGGGIDGDIGANYKLPVNLVVIKEFGFAASLNNVAHSGYGLFDWKPIKSIQYRPVPNDRTLNLGVKTQFVDLGILTNNIAAIELQNLGPTHSRASFWKKVNMGGETHFISFISLRGGVNQGYWTAGLGFNLPILKLDFASYGEEIGSNAGQLEDRRYVARVCLDI